MLPIEKCRIKFEISSASNSLMLDYKEEETVTDNEGNFSFSYERMKKYSSDSAFSRSEGPQKILIIHSTSDPQLFSTELPINVDINQVFKTNQ